MAKQKNQACIGAFPEDGYLGMGKEVQAFEKEIAAFLGVPSEWMVCVSSGMAALHLAVEAVTQPGDEVLGHSQASWRSSGGRLIGYFGDVFCLSFDDIKNITIGEGGRRPPQTSNVSLGSEAGNLRSGIRDIATLTGSATPSVVVATEPNAITPRIFPVSISEGRRDDLRQYIETGIHYKPCHLLNYYGGRERVIAGDRTTLLQTHQIAPTSGTGRNRRKLGL